MATLSGYANAFLTEHGTASFWILSNLSFMQSANGASTSVTLCGFATQADADAGVLPMGAYTFTMSFDDTVAMFSSASGLVLSAIQASSPAWADATEVAPG